LSSLSHCNCLLPLCPFFLSCQFESSLLLFSGSFLQFFLLLLPNTSQLKFFYFSLHVLLSHLVLQLSQLFPQLFILVLIPFGLMGSLHELYFCIRSRCSYLSQLISQDIDIRLEPLHVFDSPEPQFLAQMLEVLDVLLVLLSLDLHLVLHHVQFVLEVAHFLVLPSRDLDPLLLPFLVQRNILLFYPRNVYRVIKDGLVGEFASRFY